MAYRNCRSTCFRLLDCCRRSSRRVSRPCRKLGRIALHRDCSADSEDTACLDLQPTAANTRWPSGEEIQSPSLSRRVGSFRLTMDFVDGNGASRGCADRALTLEKCRDLSPLTDDGRNAAAKAITARPIFMRGREPEAFGPGLGVSATSQQQARQPWARLHRPSASPGSCGEGSGVLRRTPHFSRTCLFPADRNFHFAGERLRI